MRSLPATDLVHIMHIAVVALFWNADDRTTYLDGPARGLWDTDTAERKRVLVEVPFR